MDEIREMRMKLAQDNLQKILRSIMEKCYDRCCKDASGSLKESEKTCLAYCHDNYFQAINVVAETINKLNEQAQQR